jgi:hypothetical protein
MARCADRAQVDAPQRCSWIARDARATELPCTRQQVARAQVAAELDAARATIARQVGEIAALTMELERAQGNYQFHFAEYRRNCNAGGKHQ